MRVMRVKRVMVAVRVVRVSSGWVRSAAKLHRGLAVPDGAAVVVVHPVVLGELVPRPAVRDHVLARGVRDRVALRVHLLGDDQIATVDRRVDGRVLRHEHVLVPVALLPVDVRADADGIAAGHHIDDDIGGGAAREVAVGGVHRIGVRDARLQIVLEPLADLWVCLQQRDRIHPLGGLRTAGRGGGGRAGRRRRGLVDTGRALVAGARTAGGAGGHGQPDRDEPGHRRDARRLDGTARAAPPDAVPVVAAVCAVAVCSAVAFAAVVCSAVVGFGV